MAAQRLSRDRWVDAALASMLESGPAGAAVEPLALRLGATKGSFYWHFGSRDELLQASLVRWSELGTAAIIASVEAAGGTGQQRLRRLLDVVTRRASSHPGELLLLGSPDPSVRAAVEQVTRDRIGYIAQLLAQTGLGEQEARRRALLAYAAYLGFAQLAAGVPALFGLGGAGSSDADGGSAGRRVLVETMADLLIGRENATGSVGAVHTAGVR